MAIDSGIYKDNVLARYEHWTTFIHPAQTYLGRSYIALNRDGNIDPWIETTAEEREELVVAVGGLKSALDNLFQPDNYNYANFRNTWPHCHWHVIPRYNSERSFGGQAFSDADPTKNYAPYDRDFVVNPSVFDAIRLNIAAELKNQRYS